MDRVVFFEEENGYGLGAYYIDQRLDELIREKRITEFLHPVEGRCVVVSVKWRGDVYGHERYPSLIVKDPEHVTLCRGYVSARTTG